MTESFDRAAIKARAEKATRGPWTWSVHRVPTLEGRGGDPAVYDYSTEVIEASHSGECGCRSACTLELEVGPADAEFIAHAREDIPALLAALEEAEGDTDEESGRANDAEVRLMRAEVRRDEAERRIADAKGHLRLTLGDAVGMSTAYRILAALHPVAETTESEKNDE